MSRGTERTYSEAVSVGRSRPRVTATFADASGEYALAAGRRHPHSQPMARLAVD
jgi:hypothetical protein